MPPRKTSLPLRPSAEDPHSLSNRRGGPTRRSILVLCRIGTPVARPNTWSCDGDNERKHSRPTISSHGKSAVNVVLLIVPTDAVMEIYSLFASRLCRYCEPLLFCEYSWHLYGAVFDFRKELRRQTVRIRRIFSLHHRPVGCLFDRPGRGRVMVSAIPVGAACVGNLYGP